MGSPWWGKKGTGRETNRRRRLEQSQGNWVCVGGSGHGLPVSTPLTGGSPHPHLPPRSAWPFPLTGREGAPAPPLALLWAGLGPGVLLSQHQELRPRLQSRGRTAGDAGVEATYHLQSAHDSVTAMAKVVTQVTAVSAEAPAGASTCPGSQVASGKDLVFCLLGSILSQLKLDSSCLPRGAEM